MNQDVNDHQPCTNITRDILGDENDNDDATDLDDDYSYHNDDQQKAEAVTKAVMTIIWIVT